ncbi:MAG: twin-arginine translocation signal domain-containing protein, partial [Acidobacteria bacterium]|nr:twin-arginine translocation signal domain-containing protein [Acidobacteriota bacterium]
MKRREFLKGTALGVAATAAGNRISAGAEGNPVRVLCWSELTEPKEVYPDGINGALKEYLKTQPGMSVRTASINDPDQGLSNRTLDEVDVLIWWGHSKHEDIHFDRVAQVKQRVERGKLGVI